MPSVISGDANVSATEFGFLDGVTSGLQSQIDGKLNLAGGKILQIVRATDSTDRSTSSTSFIDVGGMSVTITPQKSDSAIIVLVAIYASHDNGGSTSADAVYQITDASNNAISAASQLNFAVKGPSSNIEMMATFLGYATPATTSATTYKLRMRVTNAGNTVRSFNSRNMGQIYAIEVSA